VRGESRRKVRKAGDFDKSQMWKENIVQDRRDWIDDSEDDRNPPYTAEYDRHTTIGKHSVIRTRDVA
jgi:hypothetical protein